MCSALRRVSVDIGQVRALAARSTGRMGNLVSVVLVVFFLQPALTTAFGALAESIRLSGCSMSASTRQPSSACRRVHDALCLVEGAGMDLTCTIASTSCVPVARRQVGRRRCRNACCWLPHSNQLSDGLGLRRADLALRACACARRLENLLTSALQRFCKVVTPGALMEHRSVR